MEQIESQGKVLWDNVARADDFFSRFRGLLGKRQLLPGEGLLISPCNQVHTFFMRFPIDVLFMTKDNQVTYIETLPPGKIGKRVKEAAYVLEVASGSAEGFMLMPGDTITIHGAKKEVN